MQEKIKQPLAEELLFGKLVHGGEVSIHLKDDALSFEITPAAPKTKPKKGEKPTAKAEPETTKARRGKAKDATPKA